jgi:hypothetical protein
MFNTNQQPCNSMSSLYNDLKHLNCHVKKKKKLNKLFISSTYTHDHMNARMTGGNRSIAIISAYVEFHADFLVFFFFLGGGGGGGGGEPPYTPKLKPDRNYKQTNI